jgi:hypothetical protein
MKKKEKKNISLNLIEKDQSFIF